MCRQVGKSDRGKYDENMSYERENFTKKEKERCGEVTDLLMYKGQPYLGLAYPGLLR